MQGHDEIGEDVAAVGLAAGVADGDEVELGIGDAVGGTMIVTVV